MPRQYTPKPHTTHPRHATFVVAADAGRARIFTVSPDDGALAELADLLNPAVRLQDHDSVSDRRGHVVQGAAGVGHAFEPRQSHEEHAAETFAKQVCDYLGKAHKSEDLARIYLLAEPAFLGLLRKNLDHATRGCVAQEIASDLTRRPAADIRAALPKVL
ncbi:MAG: host attachment protein [Nevskia sp.]|nr:host attachment protein [Nevskia sp.]